MKYLAILMTALVVGCSPPTTTAPEEGASPTPVQMPASAMTREQVEALIRERWAGSTFSRLQVEATTVQGAYDKERLSSTTRSEDAPVWLVVMEGDLTGPDLESFLREPGQVSEGARGAGRIAMTLPPEGWPPIAETISAKPQPTAYIILPRHQAAWYVGDVWGLETTGEPIEGSLQVTIRNQETNDERTYMVDFKEAAQFQLPLDSAHLPGFKDVPVQKFRVILRSELSVHDSELQIQRDRP